MSYFIRFIVTDAKRLQLSQLEEALHRADSVYAIRRDGAAADRGEIVRGGELFGQVEINRPGDRLFDEELDELKELVMDSPGRKVHVLRVLNEATAVVAVQMPGPGRGAEVLLEKLDPLWQWLFANFRGLLQADAEGYYDVSGLILEVH